MLYPLGSPLFTAWNSNGQPLSGGKLYCYEAGTTTAKATYADASGASANPFPVVLNARGEANVFFSGVAKFVLKDASDVVIWTADYIGGNGAADVSNLDGLRALGVPAGLMSINLLGYYSPGDGGGGQFYWDAASTAADNGGTVILPTGYTGSGRWLRNYYGTVNVKWFGAKGDGVTDDTAAFNAAFATAGKGGAVYVPPNDGAGRETTYLVTQVDIAVDDVKAYSDAKGEYGVQIKSVTTDAAIFMVSGFGFKAENLIFQGDGTQSAYGTVVGIRLDRSSKGDQETYANLDAEITYCGFSSCLYGVQGRGRNVFVHYCLFSVCKKGVVGTIHTWNAGANEAEFRGWRITHNRFHSIGYPSYTGDSTDMDSWCIDFPINSTAVFHNEIVSNNADFGMGLYKGSAASVLIEGNFCYKMSGPMVFTDIPTAMLGGGSFNSSLIANNVMVGTATANNPATFAEPDYGIYVARHSNVAIKNNKVSRVARAGIVAGITGAPCYKLVVDGNAISNANYSNARVGDTPAISVVCDYDCSVSFNNVYADSSPVSHAYALSVTSAGNDGTIHTIGNNLSPGRVGTVQLSGNLNGFHLTNDHNFNLYARTGQALKLNYLAQDAGGNPAEVFGQVVFTPQSATAGSEKMDIEFWSMNSGTLAKHMYIHWGGGFALPALAAPPASPPNGCIANSDGTSGTSGWGGSGAGAYRWDAAAALWKYLG